MYIVRQVSCGSLVNKIKKNPSDKLPEHQIARCAVHKKTGTWKHEPEPVARQKKGSDHSKRQFCSEAADEPVADALNWMVLAGMSAHWDKELCQASAKAWHILTATQDSLWKKPHYLEQHCRCLLCSLARRSVWMVGIQSARPWHRRPKLNPESCVWEGSFS